jgi:hypothetical protein
LSVFIVTHAGETSCGDQVAVDLTSCANRLGLDGRLPHHTLEHNFLVNGNGARISFRLPTGYLAGPAPYTCAAIASFIVSRRASVSTTNGSKELRPAPSSSLSSSEAPMYWST